LNEQLPVLSRTGLAVPVVDSNFSKNISYRFGGNDLVFRVSQSLFSSFQIDTGTQFLLKTLGSVEQYGKILDLGCGYGPLGLSLQACHRESPVHLIDRDALAVFYSRQNSQINHLDTRCYGSLDYDEVKDKDFNLVVSNIPGKAGIPVIAHMVIDAKNHLHHEGKAALVVVAPLELAVAQMLKINEAEVLFRESR